MAWYNLKEIEKFSTKNISKEMFGANFVTTYDFEFVKNSKELKLLDSLGISVLRFPGGSVTESVFANVAFETGNWAANSYSDEKGNANALTTLRSFFEVAGEIDATAQLVIPTRVAFELSAGQALNEGKYGSRKKIDADYFDHVKAFIDEALKEANINHVKITRLEIGNEFWGSGEMTAREYGYLAAKLTAFLGFHYPKIDVIIQICSSANAFSPYSNRTVFLEPDGRGDFLIHSNQNDSEDALSVWKEVKMQGHGSAPSQIQHIASEFAKNPAALNNLDGVVDHVYFEAGFQGINHERDFSLSFTNRVFSKYLNMANIDYYVSEWSPRKPFGYSTDPNKGNVEGIQNAHMVIESFFELTSNGVVGANFWPLTFGNPNHDDRVLVDSSKLNLTFGGAMFQMLADNTLGLKPIIDYSAKGKISVHGFSSKSETVLFVADRDPDGTSDNCTYIDIQKFAPSNYQFVTITILGIQSDSRDPSLESPVLKNINGFMNKGSVVELRLNGFEIASVKLQKISNGKDNISGSNVDDKISSKGGNDSIFGRNGEDTLQGNGGNDTLKGGNGSDTLYGGYGHDRLYGGNGHDRLYAGAGDDLLRGGDGNDTLSGGNGNDTLLGGLGEDVFKFSSSSGNDVVKDFQNGSDLIKIFGGPDNFSELAILGFNGNTIVSFDDLSIWFIGCHPNVFSPDDFMFIP